MYEGPYKRRGIFKPKRTDNLKPGLGAFIGRTFEYDYSGTSGEDEPYPGQTRWTPRRAHDDEFPEAIRALWVPEEDIEFLA